jgi:hypothetical protein
VNLAADFAPIAGSQEVPAPAWAWSQWIGTYPRSGARCTHAVRAGTAREAPQGEGSRKQM